LLHKFATCFGQKDEAVTDIHDEGRTNIETRLSLLLNIFAHDGVTGRNNLYVRMTVRL